MLIILSVLILSCNENKKEKKSFIKVYEGLIADKYPITMKLASNENKLNGNYFYNKSGIYISIDGKIVNDSIFIKGFDKLNNLIDVFEGNIKNGKISGTWSKPNGKNQTTFSLIESSIHFPKEKEKTKTNKQASQQNKYDKDSYTKSDLIGNWVTPHFAARKITFKDNNTYIYDEGNGIKFRGNYSLLNGIVTIVFNLKSYGLKMILVMGGGNENTSLTLKEKRPHLGDGENFVKEWEE